MYGQTLLEKFSKLERIKGTLLNKQFDISAEIKSNVNYMTKKFNFQVI